MKYCNGSKICSMVPLGNAGKRFVSELANLLQAVADSSALESVSFLTAMVMPHVLLQRPQKKVMSCPFGCMEGKPN